MKKLLALIIFSLLTAVFAQDTDNQIVTINNGSVDSITAPDDVTVTLVAENVWEATTPASGVVTYTNAPGGGPVTVSISIDPTTPGTDIQIRATIPNTLAAGTGTVDLAADTVLTTTPQNAISGIPNGVVDATATVELEVQTTNLAGLPATQAITLVYDLN